MNIVTALQQCLPLAVLKPSAFLSLTTSLALPLQQCLPLAVLKHRSLLSFTKTVPWLQQCLPLAVLKRSRRSICARDDEKSCNSAYRLRYWNNTLCRDTLGDVHKMLQQCLPLAVLKQCYKYHRSHFLMARCNSAYRLRYWNWVVPKVSSKNTFVATVLTACGIETIGNFSPSSSFLACCNSAYRLRYWNHICF